MNIAIVLIEVYSGLMVCHDPEGKSGNAKIGRAEFGCMSDQVRMEVMVQDINDKAFILDEDGEFKPVCECRSVECDEHDNVIKIKWSSFSNENIRLQGGNFNLWIPPYVIDFSCYGQNLLGTLSTIKLPRPLVDFSIGRNKFSGTLDLSELPLNLLYFNLFTNLFEGTLDLTQLPPSIEDVYLNNNKFEGTIDINKLPRSLKELELRKNNLQQEELRVEGELPASLEYIALSGNKIKRIVDGDGIEIKDSIITL